MRWASSIARRCARPVDALAEEGDVLGDRARDQLGVLGDEGGLLRPPVRSTCRRSVPADLDPPARRARADPSSSCTSVDLPLPDGPMMPTISPGSMRNDSVVQHGLARLVPERHVEGFQWRRAASSTTSPPGAVPPVAVDRLVERIEVGRDAASAPDAVCTCWP